MAKQFLDSVVINGPTNQSGLQLSKLIPGVPAIAGSPVGVDASGNVILLSPFARQVLLADVVSSNSAADFPILTAALSANALFTGAEFEIEASGTMAGALITGGTFNFWVKIGTTKVLTVPFVVNGVTLGTTYPFLFQAQLTQRSLGSSSTMKLFGLTQVFNGTSVLVATANSLPTFDTTVAQTLTFGMSWTAAASGNILTVNQASISPL